MPSTQTPRTNSPFWGYYTPEERQRLLQFSPDDLTGEITLICLEVRNFLSLARGIPPLDFARQNLATFCLVARCQAALLDVHVRGIASRTGLNDILKKAYHRARQKLGVLDYLPGPRQVSSQELQ